jgi:predicted nucleic acid-binding protein
MNFLLDTNVISEWVKPRPDPNVVSWLAEADEDRLFLSVVALAEIRRGIERLPSGRRRERLAQWLAEELLMRFEDRVLAIDPGVAETWGTITARSFKAGQTLGPMDAFVAATAQTHGLTPVTCNIKDFRSLEISVLDPSKPIP